jgi:chromosome partitioning protein
MRVLAIANHKGGVGKTATVHALGAALALEGQRRVLMVDVDPQASLTGACGILDAAERSLAEVLGTGLPGKLGLADILRPIADNLVLAPSDIALTISELGLATRMRRDSILKRALAGLDDAFDLAVLDCPPSLGLLTINALTAADAVLIPTQPQALDLRGLRLFLDTMVQIREELNPEIEIFGILVTFYSQRLLHHRDAVRAMMEARLPVLPVRIGRSVRVAEASAASESVVTYAPDNPQAIAYRQLAQEVIRWLDPAGALISSSVAATGMTAPAEADVLQASMDPIAR